MAVNKSEIIIDGNNKGALQALNGIVNAISSAEKQIRGMGGGLTSAMGTLTSAINPMILLGGAITGAAAGFSVMIKNAIDTADEVSKLSQKIGVSTETLSTLKYAGELADLSLEQISLSMGKLNQNVYDASRGTGEAVNAFRELGISVRDSKGNIKAADSVLLDLAGKFEAMRDGTRKTTLAMDVFGRSGKEMIPLLNAGKEGLSAMQEEARKLGLEISTNTGRNAEEFNDNLTRVKASFEGLAMVSMQAMLPTLIQLSQSLFILTSEGTSASATMQGIGVVFKATASLAYTAYMQIMNTATALGTLGAVVAKVLIGRFEDVFPVLKKGLQAIDGNMKSLANAQTTLWKDSKDAVKEFNDMLKQYEENLAKENASKEAARLRSAWEDQALILKNDIVKSALPEMSAKVQDIIFQHEQLADKYRNIAGSGALILQHQEAQIFNAMKLNELQALGTTAPPAFQPGDMTAANTSGLVIPQDVLNAEINSSISAMDVFFDATNERSVMMRDVMSNAFGDMAGAAMGFYQSSEDGSKELFAIQKAFSIAQAVMNTYEGATKALAFYPPPWGYIAAAGVIAAGMGNVASIASATPGESAGSRGSSGSTPSLAAIADREASSSQIRQTPQIQITINGNVMDETKLVRELAPYFEQYNEDRGK